MAADMRPRAVHDDTESGNRRAGAKVERVNHPSHYGGDTTYEVIKVLRAWLTPDEYVGFLKGNVIKYNARARLKGGAEDYAKAKWYQDELDRFAREGPK